MEILSMNVVVSAIVDPWVTTFSFVVALAMRIQGLNLALFIIFTNYPEQEWREDLLAYSPLDLLNKA